MYCGHPESGFLVRVLNHVDSYYVRKIDLWGHPDQYKRSEWEAISARRLWGVPLLPCELVLGDNIGEFEITERTHGSLVSDLRLRAMSHGARGPFLSFDEAAKVACRWERYAKSDRDCPSITLEHPSLVQPVTLRFHVHDVKEAEAIDQAWQEYPSGMRFAPLNTPCIQVSGPDAVVAWSIATQICPSLGKIAPQLQEPFEEALKHIRRWLVAPYGSAVYGESRDQDYAVVALPALTETEISALRSLSQQLPIQIYDLMSPYEALSCYTNATNTDKNADLIIIQLDDKTAFKRLTIACLTTAFPSLSPVLERLPIVQNVGLDESLRQNARLRLHAAQVAPCDFTLRKAAFAALQEEAWRARGVFVDGKRKALAFAPPNWSTALERLFFHQASRADLEGVYRWLFDQSMPESYDVHTVYGRLVVVNSATYVVNEISDGRNTLEHPIQDITRSDIPNYISKMVDGELVEVDAQTNSAFDHSQMTWQGNSAQQAGQCPGLD